MRRRVHGLCSQGQSTRVGKTLPGLTVAIPLARYVVMYCKRTGAANFEPIRGWYCFVLMFGFCSLRLPMGTFPPFNPLQNVISKKNLHNVSLASKVSSLSFPLFVSVYSLFLIIFTPVTLFTLFSFSTKSNFSFRVSYTRT